MQRTKLPVGKSKASFARPLQPSPTKMSPAVTALSLVSLSCAALFFVIRPNGAQDLPAAKPGVATRTSAASKPAVVASKPKTETLAAEDTEHQSLDFYNENVRGGMFSQPIPAPPKVEAPVVKVEKPKLVPITPPPPVNPLAGWTYTGTMQVGDAPMALLEYPQYKSGKILHVGDTFTPFNAPSETLVVKSIDENGVTFTNSSDKTNKPLSLAKSDMITVTPLNNDAAGKNPTPQGQPGQQNGQGQPGQGQTMQSGNTNFSIMGPGGQMISGDRAQRYQNRLDRGWNNGGGNNGGGNNFGGGGRGNRGGRGRGGFGG